MRVLMGIKSRGERINRSPGILKALNDRVLDLSHPQMELRNLCSKFLLPSDEGAVPLSNLANFGANIF